MQNNPYPDEPINSQSTQPNYPMEPLQPRNPQYPPRMEPGNPNYVARPPQEAQRAAADQEKAYTTTFAIAKLIEYLGWVLLVIEVILLLRFLFKLIGADPGNAFASFLYSLSNVFVIFFKGIVTDPTFGANGVNVFEWSTLIGMLIYGLIFVILRLFLRTTISRPKEPVQ